MRDILGMLIQYEFLLFQSGCWLYVIKGECDSVL